MAPCWRGPCHAHAWGSNLLASGGGGGAWSEDFWPAGLSLSQCGDVFANSVRYLLKEIVKLLKGILFISCNYQL